MLATFSFSSSFSPSSPSPFSSSIFIYFRGTERGRDTHLQVSITARSESSSTAFLDTLSGNWIGQRRSRQDWNWWLSDMGCQNIKEQFNPLNHVPAPLKPSLGVCQKEAAISSRAGTGNQVL